MKNKILYYFIGALILSACNKLTEIEKLESRAISKFEVARADLGLDFIEFKGPSVIKILERDSSGIIFGWHYIHKQDTFWMYSYVFKDKSKTDLNSTSGIHFSDNFDGLLKINNSITE